MKKSKLKRFTTTAILVAIILLMGLVPYLGYIPIGPIKLTLICIPVIIGTLALGLRSGLILGLVFGITSLIQVWYPGDPLGIQLMAISVPKLLAIIFIPRLLVPVVTYYVFRMLETKYALYIQIGLFVLFTVLGIMTTTLFLIPAVIILIVLLLNRRMNSYRLNYGTAALFGSLTNTVFFLGGLYLLYLPEPAFKAVAENLGTTVESIGAVLTGIALTNGVPEAILALIFSILILLALNRAGLTIVKPKEIEEK